MTKTERRTFQVLFLLLCFALLYGIPSLPLRDFQETRYAEIGKEMIESGNWLVPQLNGAPYLNKPPLLPWMVAVSYKIFGVCEGAARFPSVPAAVGTALAAGWLTRLIFGEGKGIIGALSALGMPGIHFHGRMLMVDTVALAMTALAVAFFFKAYLHREGGWYYFGFLACGLAVLSKSLTGVIYPVAALLLLLLAGDARRWKDVPWVAGTMLFAVITVPWFLSVERELPGFLHHHFVEQQFDRITPRTAESTFTALPRWEILLGFAGFIGPLIFLFPWTAVGNRWPYSRRTEPSRTEPSRTEPPWAEPPWAEPPHTARLRAAPRVMGILAILILLSVLLSSGRSHTYTLPAMIPVIVLIAGNLSKMNERPEDYPRLVYAVPPGLLGIVLLISLPWMGSILERVSPLMGDAGTRTAAQAAIGLTAAQCIAAAGFIVCRKPIWAGFLLAFTMIPVTVMLSHMEMRFSPMESRASVSSFIVREVPAHWPLVVADPEDRQFEGAGGWNFYTGRQVFMVAFEPFRTKYLQGTTRPEWIMDREDLKSMLESGRPFVLAATQEALSELFMGPLPGPPVARDARFGLWILCGDARDNCVFLTDGLG